MNHPFWSTPIFGNTHIQISSESSEYSESFFPNAAHAANATGLGCGCRRNRGNGRRCCYWRWDSLNRRGNRQPCLLKTSNEFLWKSWLPGMVFVEHPSVSIIDTSSLMFWTTFHRSEFMWYDPPETATAVHVNLWVGQRVIHAIGWVANRRISCGKKKKKHIKKKKKHMFFSSCDSPVPKTNPHKLQALHCQAD